jgi:hypothetical protein
MLERLLGSGLRACVIGWLFTHPGERFCVRQLTALLDLAFPQREQRRAEPTRW